MKRHAAFQDLSRDHFTGLLACLHVERAAENHPTAPPVKEAIARFAQLWRDELRLHFDEEDANLDPVLEAKGSDALVERLRKDHTDIRAMMAGSDASDDISKWAEVASRLRRHIRWEEDELFPWMQDSLTESELSALLAASIDYRTEHRGPDSVKEPRP